MSRALQNTQTTDVLRFICFKKEKKKTTAFDFLQKWFIKQFSCLQLQPVGREQKTSWGMFLSPVAPLKYNYLLEEKMVFLWFHRAAITNGTNDRLF